MYIHPWQLILKTFTCSDSGFTCSDSACLYDDLILLIINCVNFLSYRPEQSFATSLMERVWYSNVWIGLNDLNIKGVYEWSNNCSVSWTNWYVGQPDERRTDKSCVYMSLKRGKLGWMYWSDQNCTSKYAFMCSYVVGKYSL
jgi:hypothetical protein